MLIRTPADIRPSEITPEAIYQQRREFLRAGALAGCGLVTGSGFGFSTGGEPSVTETPTLAGVVKGPFSTDEAQTPFTDATSYNNFYEFGTGKSDPAAQAGSLVTRPWTVTVSGACEAPGEYHYEDIIREQQLEERIYRLRCVEAWSMVIPWVGIPLAKVLERFRPDSRARFVAFRTLHDPQQMPGQKRSVLAWPYREGLRIDEAMHPLTLLVVGMYGRVLPNQNGAPLRLMSPWKYGFKAIKSIVAIEFVESMPQTSWNVFAPDEYGFYANVNPTHSHPRWSQAKERRVGEFFKRDTLPFNGYGEQVASLYAGQDLHVDF
jgi:methionine sulfoxide reductase catalytic subunit